MAHWKFWMVSLVGAAALLGAGACGGSDDDDGNGGSTSTGTGTGTTTTPTCFQCADYTVACAGPNGCPAGDPFDLVCATSLPTMLDLNNCICAAAPNGGDCLADCAGTCALSGTGGAGGAVSGQGGDSANCMACQAAAVAEGAACETQWNACLADSSF